MNHLKKILIAAAVAVALGVVGSSSAFAQGTCNFSGSPAIVRAEGEAELIGNMVGDCTPTPGGVAVIPAAGASFTITLPAGVNITNNTANLPTITLGVASTTAATVSVSTNQIIIAFTAGNLDTFTLGGTRINASAAAVGASIIATLNVNQASGITIPNNQSTIATPFPSITTPTIKAGSGLTECASPNFKGSSDAGAAGTVTVDALNIASDVSGANAAAQAISAKTNGSLLTMTVTENISGAFTTYTDETNAGAFASNGSRLLIRLTNLPANVVVYAPNAIQLTNTAGTADTGELDLVTNADANGAASEAAQPAPTGAFTISSLISGTSITYEVVADQQNQIEMAKIPLGFFTTGTPTAGTSTASASIGIAPISTVTTADSKSPVPRFADKATAGTAVTLVQCQSNILFPWTANIAGYDTGFAIANTTSDVFGSTGQDGTCTYNFFGTNPPSGGTFTTPTVNAGAVDTELLSNMAPGFSGYVIVQCNFQLGHGFFFITNGFGSGAGPTLAQGGPGLIIPQPTGASRESIASTADANGAVGESLGH